MLKYQDPDNFSLIEGANFEEIGKISASTIAKPIISVKTSFENINLEDENYRRFIHIRLNHVKLDPQGHKSETFYEIDPCKKEQFQENEYYK